MTGLFPVTVTRGLVSYTVSSLPELLALFPGEGEIRGGDPEIVCQPVDVGPDFQMALGQAVGRLLTLEAKDVR